MISEVSKLPSLAAHQTKKADARNAQLTANIGNEMSSLWIAFLRRWGFLSHHSSAAHSCQCDDVGIGLFVFSLWVSQAGELVLNRLRLGQNLGSWNKNAGVILRPRNQSRCSDRTNFLLHQGWRNESRGSYQLLDPFDQSGENVGREIAPLPIHQGTGVHRVDWRGCWITHQERFRPALVPDALEACRNARTSNRDTATRPPT